MFIDSHLHLQDEAFDPDRDEVIGQALSQGVTRMVCNGSSDADWPIVTGLCHSYSAVRPGYGVHPWYVSQCQPDWLETLRLTLNARDSIVGEIGLDLYLPQRDEPRQELFFRQQLRLARALDRPVTIHCLKAWHWMMAVLKDEPLPRTLHFHAFNGSAEMLPTLLPYNAYFSFSGRLFAASNQRTRDIFLRIPRDRLLMETDAPDLPLPAELCLYVQSRSDGKPRNHPANLAAVYQHSAALLQMPLAELQDLIAANFTCFWSGRHA